MALCASFNSGANLLLGNGALLVALCFHRGEEHERIEQVEVGALGWLRDYGEAQARQVGNRDVGAKNRSAVKHEVDITAGNQLARGLEQS